MINNRIILFILNLLFVLISVKAVNDSNFKYNASALKETLKPGRDISPMLEASQSEIEKIKKQSPRLKSQSKIRTGFGGALLFAGPQIEEFNMQQEGIDQVFNKITEYIDSLDSFNQLLKKYNGDLAQLKKDETFINIKPKFRELIYSLRSTLPIVIPILSNQIKTLREQIQKNIESELGKFEVWKGLQGAISDLANASFDFIDKELIKFLQKLANYIGAEKNIKFLIED